MLMCVPIEDIKRHFYKKIIKHLEPAGVRYFGIHLNNCEKNHY